MIVPTGELHALPWATLPACAGRPLCVAPSAALWLRARRRARTASTRPAHRCSSPGPGCAHADAEVRALAALYGDAITLHRRARHASMPSRRR